MRIGGLFRSIYCPFSLSIQVVDARSCFCFSCSSRYCRNISIPSTRNRIGNPHVIQQLHRHLDICWLTGDDNQSLALAARGRSTPVQPLTHSARFHNLDLTRTHMSNFIDLTTSFSDDTSHKIVWDEDLLSLKLCRGIM